MNRFYTLAVGILHVTFRLVYPLNIIGREHIPKGAALVCANHSSYADPVIIALAFTAKHPLHFMAKADLFDKPILGSILRAAGSFGVHRGAADAAAIKQAMKYLKSGEKVMMFPEGQRIRGEEAAAAKSGAAMLSIRTGVSLLPVHLPAKRRLFRPNTVVIGEAYLPQTASRKATAEEYRVVADDLLRRITALGEQK
jgi:1-acyl-sn-glycerol-3-phosphate acyltransferase